MDKTQLLEKTHETLENLHEFLESYLPLANAHNTDFITKNLWEKMLCTEIIAQLEMLNELQLSQLPSGKLFTTKKPEEFTASSPANETEHDIITKVSKVEIESQKIGPCDGDKQADHCGKKLTPTCKKKWDKNAVPIWEHRDLEQFVLTAQNLTLQKIDVVMNIEDFKEMFHVSQDKLVIEKIMPYKKSHEVDIASDVCAALAREKSISHVIDLGSGRGYLGAQLALMHGLKVLGIDSSQVNTDSATNRTEKLQKHWNGLMRNAIEDKERGGKVKRGKNYKSKLRKKEEKRIASQRETNNALENDLPLTEPKPEVSHNSDTKTESKEEHVGIERDEEAKANTSTQNSDDMLSSQQTTQTSTQYIAITEFVTKETDLQALIKMYLPEINRICNETDNEVKKSMEGSINNCGAQCTNVMTDISSTQSSDIPKDILLTGLHTCGNLAANLLKLFVSNPWLKVVCNVGCCYHHLDEEFVRNPFLKEGEPGPEESSFPMSQFLLEKKFRLGRNARMLASQPIERSSESTRLPAKSLFYRALLQIILQDLTGENKNDWLVGKIAAKCKNFKEYVKKAVEKLKIDPERRETVTDEKIEMYENKYADQERKLTAFFQLRVVLAPCIEAIILLDRYCYLLEQDDVKMVYLVQMFDPVTSPRCYGLVAIK